MAPSFVEYSANHIVNKESAQPIQRSIGKRAALIEELVSQGCFEEEEDKTHRRQIITSLNQLVKQWINDLSIKRNFPTTSDNLNTFRLYAFGSYQLGVSSNVLILM